MLLEYLNIKGNAMIILSLAIILFLGFFITRLTKKTKLPNVTGYIVVGILSGPYVFKVIPETVISGMDFVTDTALAFIAFGVGRYLKLSVIKSSGPRVVIITLCEALIAAAIIIVCMVFVFRLPIALSLLLGAIGSATAPASTIMTIRQYKADGDFVNTLLQVVALDDAVSLIAFSICAAIVQALEGGQGLNVFVFIKPVLLNIGAIIIGALSGVLLSRLITPKRTRDNRLILSTAMILLVAGVCSMFDLSPLLSCMALGTAYSNLNENDELFTQVSDFIPPLMTAFFVLSGMRLSVPTLKAAGAVGVGYFIIRIAGKYVGSYTGAVLSGASSDIRKYFGLALIPQAGVSIGLALLGQRLLPADMGTLLSTIILSSSVLYEMIGPVSAKLALRLSHSFPPEQET